MASKTKKIFSSNIAVTLILFLTFAALVRFQTKSDNGPSVAEANDYPSNLIDTQKYFSSELFWKGETLKQSNWKIPAPSQGGVVSHHALTAKYLSSYFSSLANLNLKTIVLIGPNHKAAGKSPVYTTRFNWKTDFGVVESDEKIISFLKKDPKILTDDDIVGDEHSMAALMPYIAYYLSDVKVVPLVVNEMEMRDIDGLVNTLAGLKGQGIFFLGSVDFSHYLTVNETVKADVETISTINNKNYQEIIGFENSNIDSPSSIIILDKLMSQINTPQLQILMHTNSFEISNKDQLVTSYIFGVYE